MKNFLSALVLLAGMFAAVSAGAYTTSDYVQDGLFIHLDGISNAGRDAGGSDLPHDGTLKRWVDLVSNRWLTNSIAAKAETQTWKWDANAWHETANNNNLWAKFPSVTMSWANVTVETCAREDTAKSTGYFFKTSGDCRQYLDAGKYTFKRQNYGTILPVSAPATPNVGTFDGVIETTATRIYYPTNKTYAASWSAGKMTSRTEDFYVGSSGANNTTFKGALYGVRIYTKALTPAQAAWNAAVDKVRFLGASADMTDVSVAALPDKYGITGVPALGATTPVANSGGYAISLSGLSAHADDGAMAREYATGCRARFCGWTYASGIGSEKYLAEDSGDQTSGVVTVKDLVASLAWDVRSEFKLSVVARTGGKVRIGGGTAMSAGFAWVEEGAVAVEAVPDEGYEFVGWTGDVSSIASATAASTTYDLHAAAALSATFKETAHVPRSATWSGGASGAWNDGANWGGTVPGDGDTVTLEPSGGDATVVLDTATAVLGSLVVRGKDDATMTLVVSNWTSRVFANAITVGDGGTIRCVGAFTDATMSNRVWLAGGTLSVAAGGAIRADAAGYAGQNGPAWVGISKGAHKPAGAPNLFGGSYGGKQGMLEVSTVGQRAYQGAPKPYGSAEWPYDPGSGAGVVEQTAGGAIYLDFTGAVTVDGEITADSAQAKVMGGTKNDHVTGHGSGGGVLVVCSALSGSGKVTANSIRTSSGSTSNAKASAGGGGGGRIAVHYDPTAQKSATCAVTFESYCKTTSAVGAGANDPEGIGEPGTVWFTDNTIFNASYAATGFNGVLSSGMKPFTVSGDLTVAATRFGVDKGMSVTVGGDLSLAGTVSRLCTLQCLSGACVKVVGNASIAGGLLSVDGGRLDVEGNLTMDTGSAGKNNCRGQMHVYAGPVVDGLDGYGAVVKVGGTWTLKAESFVYPYPGEWGKSYQYAVPCFMADVLNVQTGAKFDARGLGWGWSYGRKAEPSGPAAGGMKNMNDGSLGAGHGGRGGVRESKFVSKRKAAYDSEECPLMPGSSAPANQWYWYGAGDAGGVIRLIIDNKLVLDGDLDARAPDCEANSASGNGGAGGSIWVTAYKLSGTGTMLANGAAAAQNTSVPCGGGGGRIAVYAYKNTFFDPSNIDSNRVGVTAGASYQPETILANGGVLAENGTIYFQRLKPIGLLLIVR